MTFYPGYIFRVKEKRTIIFHFAGGKGNTGKNKLIDPHDTVYPFMVHRTLSLLPEKPVYQSSHTSILIRRPLIDNLPDKGKIFSIIGMWFISLPFFYTSCVLI